MKKLITACLLFTHLGLSAQNELEKITLDSNYHSQLPLPIYDGTRLSTVQFEKARCMPFYYQMNAPNGLALKINMTTGEVFLGDKLIGRDPNMIEWAKAFFDWIRCADFSRCYFQIKP